MRLGQLARKLSISQSDIVEFLSRNNIQVEADSNARVTDEDSTLVIQHFNPSLLLEAKEKQMLPSQIEVEESQPTEAHEVKIENTELPPQQLIEETSFVSEESTVEKIELIKASKAELPGLKVLGKIELPETKKKEEPKIADGEPLNSEPTEAPSLRRSPRQEQRKTQQNKKEERWKNPLEAKREREAKEAEKNRREQIKIEKELRTKHYQQKVKKTSQPTRAAKKVDEPLEEMINDDRPIPRTWFGKFMRWLSTP